MWIALLALCAFNLVLGLAITILWVRNLRPPKEDPRLSKGLQLLQSKIAVLEDLSDRTDRQVKQLIQILEERARGLQAKLLHAEEMMGKIDHSVAKSLQVADIFQDKIPHEEIIERKNTSKYVEAAKLAHQGASVEEICEKVGLPRSEAEFIKKVNKEELMFELDALPEWLSKPANTAAETEKPVSPQVVEKIFQKTDNDFSNLDRIRQDFNSAVDEERLAQEKVEAIERRIEEKQRQIVEKAKNFKDQVSKKVVETAQASKRMAETAGELAQEATEAAKPVIKKVRFPKIDPDRFF